MIERSGIGITSRLVDCANSPVRETGVVLPPLHCVPAPRRFHEYSFHTRSASRSRDAGLPAVCPPRETNERDVQLLPDPLRWSSPTMGLVDQWTHASFASP